MTIGDGRAAQAADYAKAGFGLPLEPGDRPAVIVVDPARAYVDVDCPLYAGVEAAAEAMRALVELARERGIPVIFTEVRLRADGRDAGLFFRKSGTLQAFCEGSPFAEPIDGLEARPGELVITKKYASGFFGTHLASSLNADRIDTVLIAGLSTSGCVRATTLDAMQNGFVPIVVEDAVGDRDDVIHRSNLFDMQQKMAEVWPLSRVSEYVAGLAVPDA
ncbi:isochorismatase family protein [Gordonia desulfuricans]|uniref:Isochorismatase family protein n=1 Tax=Gordonia desulfuricans TaxID=89051 RepID=A0A7K3LVQ0_9ACTN|nr:MULTISPECIES: isochorismatase family protein [Gordonia]KOY49561.1 isochorismatase [Gordonia sp. NB41Y]NDK92021.1 isochorismatase family protein [Gordonia desulfuricans]WLP89079.1 isochorismatase family protein [Gordonia sp. NB41Y]